MWEVALETARLHLAPNAPSRLDCIFACPTLEGAKRFRDQYRAGSRIFAALPLNATSRVFVGDFDLLDTGNDAYVDAMTTKATKYWTSSERKEPELLVSDGLLITREVE